MYLQKSIASSIRDRPKSSYDRPAITHAQRMFELYFTLPHNILWHNCNIAELKTFGTDAEVNVSQAFKTSFLNADHLLCWIHSKNYVKRKLADLKLRFTKKYSNKIFGEKSGNVKVKGLLEKKKVIILLAICENIKSKNG